eukprot:5142705-Amphidinium_carterae.1
MASQLVLFETLLFQQPSSCRWYARSSALRGHTGKGGSLMQGGYSQKGGLFKTWLALAKKGTLGTSGMYETPRFKERDVLEGTFAWNKGVALIKKLPVGYMKGLSIKGNASLVTSLYGGLDLGFATKGLRSLLFA